MLTNIKLKNFKCFNEVSISLSALNLFSGINSSGKSSAIQALLIAFDNSSAPEGVNSKFKSSNHRIGTFNENRNFISNAKAYEIELSAEQETIKMLFTPGDDSFVLTNVKPSGDSAVIKKSLNNLLYLPANRISDADNYNINLEQTSSLGSKGEYVIDYYFRHKGEPLPDILIFEKRSRTLESQVNYWLEKLTGYKLHIELAGNNYSIKFETPNGKQIRPYHIGTGVSFIATLLIVGLSTKPGGLVIIENPEIHLHPKAQGDIIDFFCLLAKAGIQLIIESHSDHLFNGIRRSIANKSIDEKLTSVYFFKQDENYFSTPCKVALTDKGAIEKYIPNLFDQFDNDLDALLQL